MKSEELFLAIGDVDSSRLLRSELSVATPSDSHQTEERIMTRKPRRTLRNLMVAAVIISMLAVTAFAVGGFLIFESPEEMIASIFGDQTGFDHSQGGEKYFEDGRLAVIEPTFDRVPADEQVATEEIAPNVIPVGQSVAFNGYTLTVDSYMYDSTTKCGFFTYKLENPHGISGYSLQTTGEIWYNGQVDPVHVNEYGYSYIIQEKTTDTCLTATYYFKMDGEALQIWLDSQKRYTPEEFDKLLEPVVAKLKEDMSLEAVQSWLREVYGEDDFAHILGQLSDEEVEDFCYFHMAALQESERMETESMSEVITLSCKDDRKLTSCTVAQGDVVVTPISMFLDIRNIESLHTSSAGTYRVSTDNIDSVVILFEDGTEYTVFEDYIMNYTFALSERPEDVAEKQDSCLLTMMFNRLINVDEIVSITINGIEVPVD